MAIETVGIINFHWYILVYWHILARVCTNCTVGARACKYASLLFTSGMFDILSYSSFMRTMMGVIATGDSGNLASAHVSVYTF